VAAYKTNPSKDNFWCVFINRRFCLSGLWSILEFGMHDIPNAERREPPIEFPGDLRIVARQLAIFR